MERLDDGRVRLCLRVASTLEIKHWVHGWGAACEVIRPASLRRDIDEDARAMVQLYGQTADEESLRRFVGQLGARAGAIRRKRRESPTEEAGEAAG